MKLDDVHGSHSQTRTIHHATNAAIQANVVQIVLAGGNLPEGYKDSKRMCYILNTKEDNRNCYTLQKTLDRPNVM
jgi:hypothetical protein